MKRVIFVLWAFILIFACGKNQNQNIESLRKAFSQVYSIEEAGIQSLYFEVAGNHDFIRNFLNHVKIDSPTIRIYWKPDLKIKAEVITPAGMALLIPRWLDFGFAFGLLSSTDLLPLFQPADHTWQLLQKEFNLNQKGTFELIQTILENNNHEFVLQDKNEPRNLQKIISTPDNLLLDRFGSKLIETPYGLIETGYSENWLKLPNGKIVLSFHQQSYLDKPRLKIQHRISYDQVDNYWLPREIIKKERSIEKGKIRQVDHQIIFKNYLINLTLPDSIFDFPAPAQATLDLTSPTRTLNSLFLAVKMGNTSQMQQCFSAEMQLQYTAFLKNTANEITPIASIPPALLQQVKTNAQQWFFGNYMSNIKDWQITNINEKANSAEISLDFTSELDLFEGPFKLMKEENEWKIDTNPFVIFRAPGQTGQ